MSRGHLIIALAALGLTGCWTNACVSRVPGMVVETCHEYATSIFSDPTATDPMFCGGASYLGSCAKHGFTRQCGLVWVRPEDAAIAGCR